MPRVLYPLSLDLSGRPVLMVGGGPVAARKLGELLRCGAAVTVVAPQPGPALERLAKAVRLIRRGFQSGDEQGHFLVFACTGDAALNREIGRICGRANILCNVADAADAGSFNVPGVIRKGQVAITVSTGGAAPGLTRHLKRLLSQAIGDEVADLAVLLGRFRAALRSDAEENRGPEADPGARGTVRQILETLPYRQLLETLRQQGPAAVEAYLHARLSGPAGIEGGAASEAAAGGQAAPGQAPRIGSVTLVGAGPGNPKLLTLAALEAIQRAEVIVHDRLIPEETLNLAPADCLLVPAGKRGHAGNDGRSGHFESARQEDIEARLVEHALAGKRVVRLKGGDPFVYGRGFEEILALEAKDIPWALIPGVSSVTAAPAWAGIPLTHRGAARSFAVMSGMAYSETNTVVPKADTIVLVMGLHRLHEIVPAFLAQGWSAETPVAAIQDATLPDQRVCIATLATIAEATAQRGFDSPTLLVIGQVVALSQHRPY